jgi:hypothetical protein
MKNTIINIVLLLSSLAFSAYASGQSSVWATAESIETVTQNEEFQYLQAHLGIEVTQPLTNSRQPHLQKVYEFSCQCDEVELYASMHKVSDVSGIEYGPKYETLNEPDDYSLFQNWNNNTTSSWHLDLIWAQAAWDVTHGTVPVAISDQNYFVNHEDLVGKILHYDTTNTSSQGHGTAVATLAGGNTDNGQMISSIGYDTQLGLYRMNYNEVLQAAYDGYKVINMSWTSGCNYSQYLDDALHEVYGLGSFLVASAGNGSTCGGPTELVYPSAYDVVFSVSSVDHNDSHENLNSPQSLTHQYNSTVDLTAPGYNVPLTAAPGWSLFGSGTSYASPIVAGTAGLIMSAYPGITPNEVKDILQSTAVNIDAQNPNYIGMLGAGRLMAGEAVKTALAYYIQSQNTSPLDPITEPVVGIDLDVLSDGNNGHGNDDGGFDSSNPGQGNGNNGNGRPNGNGNNPTNHKSFNIVDGVYDMTGRKVTLEYAPSGMYLVVRNGEVINKVWK